MSPYCPQFVAFQVQHLVSFFVGLAGQVLGTVATGVNQILTDLGSLFTDYSSNCTPMAQPTTGTFGDNVRLIYWISLKRLWELAMEYGGG